MTAQQIEFQTAVFPGLDAGSTDNVTLVDPTLGFYWPEPNVRTLSTNGISLGENIVGPLYVPELASEQCRNATAPYIPANVTRFSDLPPTTEYHQIAIAPWSSAQCVYEFLDSAMTDPLLRAFIFFPTDNSSATPPAANDALWDLDDGGHWKTDHDFAIYAIPSTTGNLVMPELAAYSGNLTTVPNGHELSDSYQPTDYVRQIVQIPTNGGNQLPSLWVFLLIVLGLMIVIICGSSVGVHWHQKRMRNHLRDRVVRGEVDLEALGIRRLTVPQEVLDRMPLYTYHAGAAAPTTPTAEDPSIHPGFDGTKIPETGTATPVASGRPIVYLQPTCAICLEDFDEGETTVRELPCHHIYHPDCVDNFLHDNSSLCPLCKKTVLPRGYCPAVITNAMVRRERWVRRVRQRAAARGVSDSDMRQEEERVRMEERTRDGFMQRMAIMVMGGTSSRQRPATAADLEMQRTNASVTDRSAECPEHENRGPVPSPPAAHPCSTSPAPGPNAVTTTETAAVTSPSERPAAGTASRREWARQRAMAMIGRDHRSNADIADDEEVPRTRWRKVLGRIWPSMG